MQLCTCLSAGWSTESDVSLAAGGVKASFRWVGSWRESQRVCPDTSLPASTAQHATLLNPEVDWDAAKCFDDELKVQKSCSNNCSESHLTRLISKKTGCFLSFFFNSFVVVIKPLFFLSLLGTCIHLKCILLHFGARCG